MRYGFDETWRPRIVAEYLTKAPYTEVEAVLDVHVSVPPDAGVQLVTPHEVPSAFNELGENSRLLWGEQPPHTAAPQLTRPRVEHMIFKAIPGGTGHLT